MNNDQTSTNSNEWNLYQQIDDAIIAQIKKYAPELEVTLENVKGERPAYPYVSISIYDDDDQQEFNTIENEPFNIHMDLKAVSNIETEAKAIGMWLRKLLFLHQPQAELLDQHIVAVSVSTIPNVNTYLDVDWEFIAGADYTLQVQDDFQDDTQPGYISHVSPKITFKNTKGAELNDTN
ncbi:phage neck terminator protein [Lentilactobacillus kosonis]|uniref:Phage neck terminator protein gp12-like domain-containing protein n=1 Tax=Lentilactobacillus kosonis TaxID=2810561 RepID=A0A401FPS6_9LACO|nr:hypothetical protein [Lentilactobacillus kosonis]GAY74278.1 hypothetical protein NBRC111893_2424 [Lentilactobacillus kosonis]